MTESTEVQTRPARIQLRRTKGWRKPEGAIVVARPSRWGNWYAVEQVGDIYNARLREHCVKDAWIVRTRDKWGNRTGQRWGGFDDKESATRFAVTLYRAALEATYLEVDGALNREHYLGALRGHDLACWCPPDAPCHADVLLELANAS